MNGDSPLVPSREWTKRIATDSFVSPMHFALRVYLIDRYTICQTYGRTSFVRESRAPYPSRNIGLSFHGINVEEIEVHSLQPGEADFPNNIPKIIAELGVEPVEYGDRGVVTTQAEKK
jgi:hypothetical protein